MALLLHLDRALDELHPTRCPKPAADATHLVRMVHALRRIPLRVADLRTLVPQAVAYGVPFAWSLLVKEPLLDAYFYEGDLLPPTQRQSYRPARGHSQRHGAAYRSHAPSAPRYDLDGARRL
ncbi:contact-dependent growth inhibition system immunity protein [Streptomyces sp. NBC_00209]|uniref:contact-dependent growth inhibition system immunity protein n=1 Tax=Streptomyces sp. NBC_00209 TaxID=2975682 RepID=UPI00324B5481